MILKTPYFLRPELAKPLREVMDQLPNHAIRASFSARVEQAQRDHALAEAVHAHPTAPAAPHGELPMLHVMIADFAERIKRLESK
jgi:hypothetical protein